MHFPLISLGSFWAFFTTSEGHLGWYGLPYSVKNHICIAFVGQMFMQPRQSVQVPLARGCPFTIRKRSAGQ
jgi:hypothetical protein